MPRSLLFVAALAACGAAGSRADAHEPADEPGLLWAAPPPAGRDEDSTVAAARAALADGRPYAATRALEPVLRVPARRTPEVVLLAAQAASEWGGWAQTVALLAHEPWLDAKFGGRGRVLLARAALAGVGAASPGARAADSLAAVQAARSLASASGDTERGARETLLARADDRLDLLDSARAHYLAAARLLPNARDWLLLRAAGATPSAAERQRDYAGVRGAAAAERRTWTEAQARERTRDFAGAAEAYAALGAPATALRLRLVGARDPDARAAVRRDLVALVEHRAGTPDARAAVDVLDASFTPLTPAEQLAVARSASEAGPAARAAAGYAAAFAASSGTDADRYAFGGALARLGRDRDAIAQFALVGAGSRRAPAAAYASARALLHAGDGAGARAALSTVRATFAADTAAAAGALYLLGDLARDDGREGEARARWRELVTAYPTSTLAPEAGLRAAIIALAADSARAAAAELDALAERPENDERTAAAYWAGRAWAAAGEASAARARWQPLADEPLALGSADAVATRAYYQLAARRRLGRALNMPTADALAPDAAADDATRRVRLLEQLGLDAEARFEDDALARAADESVDRLAAAAAAFRARGETSRGIGLAERALGRGAPRSAQLYRTAYPLAQEGVIRQESRARGLDPALVAAVIWQESRFTARATSPAGARGLMQLLPSVGASIAKPLGIAPWDPVLLYQPDVNVQLGVRHLAAGLPAGRDPAFALAAYNAGASRVTRWTRTPGTADPELFVERVPYAETRDYVRIILTNREIYHALYGLGAR